MTRCGNLLPLLTIISQIASVYPLMCYDCGPLTLPSSQCSKSRDCTTGYCTYCESNHYLLQLQINSDNRTIENRSEINLQCTSTPQLNAPGGSVFSTLNRCEEMREGNYYYRLKICNDMDLCNLECNISEKIGYLAPLYMLSVFQLRRLLLS